MNVSDTPTQHSNSTTELTQSSKVKDSKVSFQLWQLLLPVGISLFVVYLLLKENITADSFKDFSFTWHSMLGIGLAILAFGIQNAAMAHRYHTLAYPYLSTGGALRVTFLADFASAVTPSAVGGSSVVFLFLGNEGVSAGRATAITISGLFLDELFMSIISLVLLLFVHQGLEIGDVPALAEGLNITFIVLTVVLSLWTLILYISLFHKSSWVGNTLFWFTSWKPLRKWRGNAEKLKRDLLVTSQEMKHKNLWYWIKLFGATIVSWSGRFGIACMLIFGFGEAGGDLWMAYLRQMVIWLLAIIMPTPGGSGFAEYMFQIAYVDYFPNTAIALMVALIWRTITSFSYLFIGPIILMYQLRHKKPVTE